MTLDEIKELKFFKKKELKEVKIGPHFHYVIVVEIFQDEEAKRCIQLAEEEGFYSLAEDTENFGEWIKIDDADYGSSVAPEGKLGDTEDF